MAISAIELKNLFKGFAENVIKAIDVRGVNNSSRLEGRTLLMLGDEFDNSLAAALTELSAELLVVTAIWKAQVTGVNSANFTSYKSAFFNGGTESGSLSILTNFSDSSLVHMVGWGESNGNQVVSVIFEGTSTPPTVTGITLDGVVFDQLHDSQTSPFGDNFGYMYEFLVADINDYPAGNIATMEII